MISLNPKKLIFKTSQLLNEFKGNVSQYKKDSVSADIAALKASWANIKRDHVSTFEKESIKIDINIISKFIQKIVDRFKG